MTELQKMLQRRLSIGLVQSSLEQWVKVGKSSHSWEPIHGTFGDVEGKFWGSCSCLEHSSEAYPTEAEAKAIWQIHVDRVTRLGQEAEVALNALVEWKQQKGYAT